ncbi:MAG: hypothetical protein JST85_25075 [Acidobacteria bacterium]|nr:hypothetical protein [Acidobacteriota bacterium]
MNGLTKTDLSNFSKFARGIEVCANLEKQKAIVARQSLIARIEQLKADIEIKMLELIELKGQLKEL